MHHLLTSKLPSRWHHALLLDVGGTSLKWMIIDNGQITDHGRLVGFNPYRQDWIVLERLFHEMKPVFETYSQPIHYYGAGLAQDHHQERTRSALARAGVPKERIAVVDSDLMLCAHFVWEMDPVIIGILGTGSSVVRLTDGILTSHTRSLGFLLGDEGGGTDIGLQMIKAYTDRAFSTPTMQRLSTIVGPIYEQMWSSGTMDPTARTAHINAFAQAAHTLQSDAQIAQMIDDSLRQYVQLRLLPEVKTSPVGASIVLFGGTAAAYQSRLEAMVGEETAATPVVMSGVFDTLMQT